MPDKWGNDEDPGVFNCNMIPAAGRHNRLHVVDVDTDDVDEPAIWAVNDNAGANSRALRVEGVSKLEGKTQITGQLEVGDKIWAYGGGGITFGDEVHFEGAALLENGGESVEMFTFQSDAVMNGKTKLKGNELIVNDAASLAAGTGCGLVFNSAGHPGPGEPCIDFYVDGACRAYVDSTGFHNV